MAMIDWVKLWATHRNCGEACQALWLHGLGATVPGRAWTLGGRSSLEESTPFWATFLSTLPYTTVNFDKLLLSIKL